MRNYRSDYIIQAERWFKNGDVLEAKTYPIDSDSDWICIDCGFKSYKHNNCKTKKGYHIVCPGNWIVKHIDGYYYIIENDIFKVMYRKTNENYTYSSF